MAHEKQVIDTNMHSDTEQTIIFKIPFMCLYMHV